MLKTTIKRARLNARELGASPTMVQKLREMNVGDLAELYREIYGEPTRSRNKDYLRKRLTFRLQELAHGGLSPRALAKIAELGDELPERWRIRQAGEKEIPLPKVPRDPRLPPVGTVVRRDYQDATHEVTIATDGFDYAGRRYKTLSAVAKQITGAHWNGFAFFGLTRAHAEPNTADGESTP